MTRKKSPAQLNREIAAALAGRKPGKTSKVHLLKTRGGTECGEHGESSADINWVTCPKCLRGHAAHERGTRSHLTRSKRRHETIKKPGASGKKKQTTKIDVDQIVKMFGLPAWDDIDELNSHYYWESAKGAEDPEAAEQEARDDLYGKWYDAVTGVAESLFGEHGLDLDPIGKHKDKRPYYFKIVPKTDWKDAANKIRTTMGGVGYFDFNTLREFLDSGPYTATQAVLSHLGTIADYPRVYGSGSARTMYDSAMR
jgi:hypothetical protein